jgi:hypothetical protein
MTARFTQIIEGSQHQRRGAEKLTTLQTSSQRLLQYVHAVRHSIRNCYNTLSSGTKRIELENLRQW